MSAMLGEGVSEAEVLTEGVMRPSEVSGCNLNTMLPLTPEREAPARGLSTTMGRFRSRLG